MMLKPAYKLTIGNKAIDTTEEPQASTLVDLTVSLDLDVPADRFTLVLGQVGRLKPDRNDEATLELGYADNGNLVQVMTGTIVSVEPGLITNRIIGHTAATKLLRTFVDQTYESKQTGQIIRDLATQAEVEVATAEEGIRFSAYVINSRRSIYHHMRDLAELSGFDLYINAAGQLVCKKFVRGETVHLFEYARHIIELEVLQTPARANQVEAWGESPGGNQGSEGWAWLTRDFSSSKGIAGSGIPKLLLERPALRDANAARMAAEAALTTIQRQTQRGRLLTLGRPEVKLGDAIRLREMPNPAFNDIFQVRSVTHRLTKETGFTTLIEFRSVV